MIKKLRQKFILISAVAVASVMVLLCLIVNIANFISVNSRLNRTVDMISTNEGTIPSFEQHGMPGEKPDGRFGGEFNEETPFSTRFFVLKYSSDGKLIESRLDKIAAVTDEDLPKYLNIAVEKKEGYGFTDGYKYKITKQSDSSFMAVFLDSQREISEARNVLIVSVAATVICIALICVIIVLFSKRAMEPVIQSTVKQKQFITDASHELKTPITVIATSLSVLEMEVGRQKWIDKAKAQTEKLKELVNSLVSLSRLDEESPVNKSEFDLSGALSETAESFADFSQQNGHRLDIDIQPGIKYCGDEYAVRQLASILLDNAVKYSLEGTPVSFCVTREKRGITVKTVNDCDNIANVKDLDRLFDRFYRADEARNSQTGGFGIGLSMARSIAEAHNGTITASSEDGRRIEFTAKLR